MRGLLRLAAACLAMGALSLALALVLAVATWTLGGSGAIGIVRAASPIEADASAPASFEPSPVPSPADTRSSGVGPGLVGQPFLAVLVVVGVAGLAVGAAAGYARLAASREPSDGSGAGMSVDPSAGGRPGPAALGPWDFRPMATFGRSP